MVDSTCGIAIFSVVVVVVVFSFLFLIVSSFFEVTCLKCNEAISQRHEHKIQRRGVFEFQSSKLSKKRKT